MHPTTRKLKEQAQLLTLMHSLLAICAVAILACVILLIAVVPRQPASASNDTESAISKTPAAITLDDRQNLASLALALQKTSETAIYTPLPTATPNPVTAAPTPSMALQATKEIVKTAAQAAQNLTSHYGYILRDDITNVAPNGWKGCSLPKKHQIIMQDACREYDVPYTLILGLCQKESGFDPTQVSATNDYGYMQINECNIAAMTEMGLDVINNPEDNIKGGVYLFSQHYHAVNEDAHFALMCYNMGAGRAKQLRTEGTYSSKYSRQVMEYANHWSELFAQEG